MPAVFARPRGRLLLGGVLLGLLSVPLPARAQVTEDQKLVASDAAAGAWFGAAVALVETEAEALALIGAPRDGERGPRAGAVYAYRYDEGAGRWVEEAKLWPEEVGENSYVGVSVALSADGTLALVGGHAPDSNDQTLLGRVHVFRRVGQAWGEEATLAASDETPGNAFGCALARSADGEVVVVGACQADGTYGRSGAVYIFRRVGSSAQWEQEAKLSTERVCFFTAFGAAVAVSAGGERVAVGEPCGEGGDPPALSFFHRSGTADDPNGGWDREALFDPMAGSAVSLSDEGDLALAGTWAGQVVALQREGEAWVEASRLTGSDGPSGGFGSYSIALKGSNALIGDGGADGWVENSGAAYLFRHVPSGTWAEEAKLVAGDGELNDEFGRAVALSEQFALVGARWAGGMDAGSQTGSAYAFDLGGIVVVEPQPTAEDALALAAYPNPFVSALTVAYTLPRGGPVRLALYDVLGREIAVVAKAWQGAGDHRVRFEASHLPGGLYVVHLEAGPRHVTRRVALLR